MAVDQFHDRLEIAFSSPPWLKMAQPLNAGPGRRWTAALRLYDRTAREVSVITSLVNAAAPAEPTDAGIAVDGPKLSDRDLVCVLSERANERKAVGELPVLDSD
jgi:hypothetical protein